MKATNAPAKIPKNGKNLPKQEFEYRDCRIGVVLTRSERNEIEHLARCDHRTISTMARLLMLKGLHKFKAEIFNTK